MWLGGLALALGCKAGPPSPSTAMSSPLLPESIVPTPIVASAAPKIESGGATLPKPMPAKPEAKMPPAKVEARSNDGPDLPPVLPPKDVIGRVAKSTSEPNLLPVPAEAKSSDLFVSAPKDPVPPITTSIINGSGARSNPAPEVQFGHGPDYRWVAGVLDRHQKTGHWSLRFADAGDDNPWGGKVRLLDDQRLNQFRSGDAVLIEGELLAPASAAGADGPSAFPPYRITSMRLVRKGE